MKAAFIFIAARVASGAACVGDGACAQEQGGSDCCTHTAHYVYAYTCASHRRCGCLGSGLNPENQCTLPSDCCSGHCAIHCFGKDQISNSTVAAEPNIVELAQSVPALSTLVTAVVAGDLVDTLTSPGPFAVFAPTNDGFAALPSGTVDTLLKPENKVQLASGAACVGDGACAQEQGGGDCCTHTAHFVTILNCGSRRRCGCISFGGCKYDSDCCEGTCGTHHNILNICYPASNPVVNLSAVV